MENGKYLFQHETKFGKPSPYLPDIEIIFDKTASKGRHSYFLYRCAPTKWRENWRNISGFSIRVGRYYLLFCVWRKEAK